MDMRVTAVDLKVLPNLVVVEGHVIIQVFLTR